MKSALVFPGQGAQYAGMGRDICRMNPEAKALFERAQERLKISLQPVFTDTNEWLEETEIVQPVLLTASIAMAQQYLSHAMMPPDYICGHSLGEYSALVIGGVLSFDDAVYLVHQRGRLMKQQAGGIGKMCAVTHVRKEIVLQLCQQFHRSGKQVFVSNDNTPEQTVISGLSEDMEEMMDRLINGFDARIILLKTDIPFHTPLLSAASERFHELLSSVEFHSPNNTVLSNYMALPYTDNCSFLLEQHMVSTVKWRQTIEYLQAKGVDTVIETGPGHTIKNMLKRSHWPFQTYSYSDESDRDYLSKKGYIHRESKHVTEDEYREGIKLCYTKAIDCPIPLQANKIEAAQIVESCSALRDYVFTMEKENRTACAQDLEKAQEMLNDILAKKCVVPIPLV